MASLVQRSSGSPNILYPCSQANLTMSPYCRPTPIMKVCWGESRLGHQIPIDGVSYQAKWVYSLLFGVIVMISPVFCLTLTLRKTSRPGTVLHAGGTGCSVNRKSLPTGKLSHSSIPQTPWPQVLLRILNLHSIVTGEQGTDNWQTFNIDLTPLPIFLTDNRSGHGLGKPSFTNYFQFFLKSILVPLKDVPIVDRRKIVTGDWLTLRPAEEGETFYYVTGNLTFQTATAS